jgi:pimeloyl-ACP methyl ester carboxylesterase
MGEAGSPVSGVSHDSGRCGDVRVNRDRIGTLLLETAFLAVSLVPGAMETASAGSSAFQPTFESVPCPPGVTAEEGTKVSCGYLTALENRASPNGRTIRLFVTKAEPLEGNLPSDPMLQIGSVPAGRDLGWAATTRGVGAIAGRVNFILDVRGTGYSEPNLSCPEIERLTDPSAGITLGTPEMQTAFLQAVQACHDRLTSSGVDLPSYNLAEMAADAEDLRVALGIDEWNLITYGTTSSIAFEIMRQYPEHIRSVSFDSPMPPQVDRFTQAVVGTEWAFGQVVRACNAIPSCHRAYPHLRVAWREALRHLHAHPSSILDEDLKIVVDDATAVRQLRNKLALGGHFIFAPLESDIREFPLAVYDLMRHGWVNGEPAGRDVGWASAPPFDVGVDIQWWPGPAFFPPAQLSHGTMYSYLCHDEVPFIDQAALAEAAGSRPWYVEAYVQSPYPEICEHWNVGQAATDPHQPLTSDIPTLMLVGRFDPFSPLPLVKDTATRLSNSSIVKVAAGRNVLDNDCTIGIRNAFVDHPGSPPDTSCVGDLPGIRFILPPPPTTPPKPGDAVISTVAGDGAFGSSGDGNLATRAQLELPSDVSVDPDGNLYILELDSQHVRKVDASSGLISTVVGPPTGLAPPPPGDAAHVEIGKATALAIDAHGDLYVGGGLGGHHVITRVDPSGNATIIAGTGEKGFSGDGGPATEAKLSWARDIAVDDAGNVYVADFGNNRIRKVDTSGIITTIAGTGEKGFSGDGGPAAEAKLNHPGRLFIDSRGRVYVADWGNRRIRRISRRGIITTVAGNGRKAYTGDGGPATEAAVGGPIHVWGDAAGNLYIAQHVDCACIRKVDTGGIITTVAGTRVVGYSGDGGPAASAELGLPSAIEVGPDGALYIADFTNLRVRKVVFP